MTEVRLASLVTSPVVKGASDPHPYLALEHIESGTGRLLPGTVLENRVDAQAVKFHEGDVLFGKLRPYLQKVVHATLDGVASGELLVLRPEPDLHGRYLYYLALSRQFLEWANASSYGVKMPRTSWEVVGQYRLAPPTLEGQRLIADFLDREMHRIDTLVEAKRKLIDLLAEKRTALITHTVTKGLDPSVPMKDSGAWFGAVPTDWDVVALGRTTERVQTGSTPPTAAAHHYEHGSIPWFGPSSFGDSFRVGKPSKLLNQSALDGGAVRVIPAGSTLVVVIGATLGRSGYLNQAGTSNQQISALIPNQLVVPEYLAWVVKASEPEFVSHAPRTTLPILSNASLASIRIPLPSLDVQRRVHNRLGAWTSTSSAAAEAINRQLTLLAEYRQALITAAVTGQLDEATLKGDKSTAEAMGFEVPG